MFSRGNHLNSPTLLPADLAIFPDWLTRETRILAPSPFRLILLG